MSHPSPRCALTWSVRLLCVTGPLALFALLAWGFQWLPGTRPFLVLMVYQALLLLTVAAAASALLAGCHLAIHQAFRAGYKTGVASASGEADGEYDPGQDPVLRLVE